MFNVVLNCTVLSSVKDLLQIKRKELRVSGAEIVTKGEATEGVQRGYITYNISFLIRRDNNIIKQKRWVTWWIIYYAGRFSHPGS